MISMVKTPILQFFIFNCSISRQEKEVEIFDLAKEKAANFYSSWKKTGRNRA